MAATSVDIEGMIKAGQGLESAHNHLQASYNNMRGQAESLQVSWRGETSSAFGVALAQWLDDFGAVLALLQGIGEALANNTGVYGGTVDVNNQVTKIAAGSLGKLPGL
jgi:WXG100 family type VII secretion target